MRQLQQLLVPMPVSRNTSTTAHVQNARSAAGVTRMIAPVRSSTTLVDNGDSPRERRRPWVSTLIAARV